VGAHPLSRFRRWLTPLAVLGLACRGAPLQAQLVIEPGDAAFWVGATTLVAGAAAFDGAISSSAARNPPTSLDRLANALQPLGLERYDAPILAGTWVVARVVGSGPGNAVLRIAAGYVTADLLESALKFAVGRHRPDTTGGGPWRFRPFSAHNEWQSFPSAHTTHVFVIAAGIAEEVHNPVVRVVAYGTAVLVGWQRIESRAHWPSDVAASAALAVAASETTNRWLGRVMSGGASSPARVRVLASPTGIVISAAIP